MNSGACSKPQGDSRSELISPGSVGWGRPRRKHYYATGFRPRGWQANFRPGPGQPSGLTNPGGRLGAGGGRQPVGGEPASTATSPNLRLAQFLGARLPAGCADISKGWRVCPRNFIGTLALLRARLSGP